MVTRAITTSITPADGITNDELWREMRQCWNAVQRAANAAMREYFAGDPAATETTTAGKVRLAKLDKEVSNKAYHAARAAAPELTSSPVSDICQRVRGRYLSDRWAVQVAAQKSVPTFRSPLPLSIRAQNWDMLTGTDEHGRETYLVRFPLAGRLRNDRPTLRLICRTGRDAALLKKIWSGEYKKATLEILAPGWVRKGAIRAKVVFSKPDNEPVEPSGVFNVSTGKDHLLIGHAEGRDEIMRWNADWLRSRIIAYETRRHRVSEDLKHERRAPKHRRRIWREDAGRSAEKHKNRVKTAIQQIAAQVVGRAKRCGCNVVELDNTDQSWIESFPWYQLKQELSRCCENNDVIFRDVSGDKTKLSGDCPAERPGGSSCTSTADGKPCSSERNGRPM